MKKNNISKFGTVAAVAALILGSAPKASAGHGPHPGHGPRR